MAENEAPENLIAVGEAPNGAKVDVFDEEGLCVARNKKGDRLTHSDTLEGLEGAGFSLKARKPAKVDAKDEKAEADKAKAEAKAATAEAEEATAAAKKATEEAEQAQADANKAKADADKAKKEAEKAKK